jgi:hypothetical protein
MKAASATLACRFNIFRHFAVSVPPSIAASLVFTVRVWDGKSAVVGRDLTHVGRIV